MFDTHAIARTLTAAGIQPEHADAITDAVRQAAEHDNAAEPLANARDLAAGLADLRTEIATMESRLTWRFAGAMLAQTGVILAAVIGAAVAILRMLGS